jgi:hypothetical protein
VKRSILIAASLLTFATFATLAACDKPATDTKPDDKNTTTTTNATTEAGVATTTTSPTPAATPVTINDSDLSTPADFAETAEKAITTKNYKTELSTLETEMAKE